MIGEAELVEAAHAGDAGSLGLLFERHRPRLLARAYGILGYGGEAEDAVHDTFLIALRKIHTLADPSAWSAWLDAIVGNVCRGYYRNSRTVSLDGAAEPSTVLDDPDAHLDRGPLKDWIWKALARLPETLRMTVLLRHFGNYSSYDEISEELAIPVGTVRSRLAEARRKLADELTGLSRRPDYDEQRSRTAWNGFYRDALENVNRGIRDDMVNHCRMDMQVISGGKLFRGRTKMELEIDGDIQTGTLNHPLRIYSSGNVTVIDSKVTNPPDNPTRCPVGFGLVLCRQGDRSHRAYLYPGKRVPLPPDWS